VVTIGALDGFNSAVALTASGLPTGAGATFNPTSVMGAGSSTMSVTTASTTPAGTYTVTITGTSGGTTHTTTVTLIVNGSGGGGNPDFTIAAAPSTLTIAAGQKSTYTITITAKNSFKGNVTLKATGLPARTFTQFVPAFVTGSGTSTLTVFPQSTAPKGTVTLTITGTSGSLTHSTTVSLTVD